MRPRPARAATARAATALAAALLVAAAPTHPAGAAPDRRPVPVSPTEPSVVRAPVTWSGEPVPVSPTQPSVGRAPVGVGERPEAVTYVAPVAAPVRDPFRPPATPYGPGNRGLEHATEAGAEVHAAAGGAVTFAGRVAGTGYVTIQHADRARTTYGPLAEVGVAAGDPVAQGDVLGAAAGALLWTVRLGDAYLDPAILLAASGQARARLVPVPGALGGG